MKILFATTIATTMDFYINLIGKMVAAGHRVDIATNEAYGPVADVFHQWGCTVYPMPWERSPLKKGNIRAIRAFGQIVREKQYDIVHCHTPVAAACVRLACRSMRREGLKVVYTAHGFHFYHGAPIINWLLYFPAEWLCSFWTDMLIAINGEDTVFAKKHLHAKRMRHIMGVGIDTARFADAEIDILQKRAEIQVPKDSFLMLSVGELDVFKNHEVVVRSLPFLPGVHYAVAGDGDLAAHLQSLAGVLQVADRVHLLGYRRDVAALYKAADVFVFPSLREGLPVSLMEAMAAGLPAVCSNIRGNNDLVRDAGLYCDPHRSESIAAIIRRLQASPALMEEIGRENAETAKQYDSRAIDEEMMAAYQEVMA